MSTKKDAYYFSHDANAKDDFKCMLLIEELGLEGYGIFWILIETLREQENYKYPLRLLSVLARKYNTTVTKMEVVVKNYQLFIIEDDTFFFSKSLNNRMEIMNKQREQRRIAGKVSAAKRKVKQEEQLKQLKQIHLKLSEDDSTQQPLNDCSTTAQQIKEKEKKEKEKKEKEKKEKKRSIQEDVSFLSNLKFTDVNNKSLKDLVDNFEIFNKTDFTIHQLITYSNDNREYLVKELEYCKNQKG